MTHGVSLSSNKLLDSIFTPGDTEMPHVQYDDLTIFELLDAGDRPPVIWHHGLMTSGSDVKETPVHEVLEGRHVCGKLSRS